MVKQFQRTKLIKQFAPFPQPQFNVSGGLHCRVSGTTFLEGLGEVSFIFISLFEAVADSTVKTALSCSNFFSDLSSKLKGRFQVVSRENIYAIFFPG